MIRLFNVSKIYEKDWYALKKINLHIQKGEFIFLTGASGAGKTTLLKLLYMAEFPSEGQVIVAGYNSAQIKSGEIPYLRRKIGVVFQDFKLLMDRDIYANLYFALRVIGTQKKKIKSKVLNLLSLVGLSHKLNSMPYELSGGEQQRIAIARALINDPFILLADEPTGNLDPKVSEDILRLIRDINIRGTTVIMATHNPNLIKRFAHRVVKLKRGAMVENISYKENKSNRIF